MGRADLQRVQDEKYEDISRFLMIFIAAGSILWLTYGFIVTDVFIIGTNAAGLTLMTIVSFMKKRYDKQLEKI